MKRHGDKSRDMYNYVYLMIYIYMYIYISDPGLLQNKANICLKKGLD